MFAPLSGLRPLQSGCSRNFEEATGPTTLTRVKNLTPSRVLSTARLFRESCGSRNGLAVREAIPIQTISVEFSRCLPDARSNRIRLPQRARNPHGPVADYGSEN